MMRVRLLLHRNRFLWLMPLLGVLVAWLALPPPQFEKPYSTVLIAEDSTLLGARIASDGQWRFPPVDSVPEKFRLCIESFEDKRFRYHPGVDPIAMSRAIWQNLTSGKRVSGASTLTMQTVRLSRNQQARTLAEKLRELLIATRYELGASKDEILRQYASHVPFGANIVGLNAAAWKYFNRPPGELSWAENATLAVLPNAPS
ncbi:MAG: transglycosylase domain-containing protein, partial [Bacteroidota bacterium]